MKTTIDLPDAILNHANAVAAQRKISLTVLILEGLAYAIQTTPEVQDRSRRARAERLIAALNRGRNQTSVGRLRRDELYDRHRGVDTVRWSR